MLAKNFKNLKMGIIELLSWGVWLRIYWKKEDGLECVTVNNGDCYYRNMLIMDDVAGEFDDEIIVDCDGVIATYDNFYGVSLQFLCKNEEIKRRIYKYIIDDVEIWCDFIARINYPNKYNELHMRRRDKSLLEYVNWKMDNN